MQPEVIDLLQAFHPLNNTIHPANQRHKCSSWRSKSGVLRCALELAGTEFFSLDLDATKDYARTYFSTEHSPSNPS